MIFDHLSASMHIVVFMVFGLEDSHNDLCDNLMPRSRLGDEMPVTPARPERRASS